MTATVQQQAAPIAIDVILDAIVGRLTYDEEFATALAKDPLETLDRAGLHMDKEAVEFFIKNDPERFDKVCDSLSGLINPDTLIKLQEPTCG